MWSLTVFLGLIYFNYKLFVVKYTVLEVINKIKLKTLFCLSWILMHIKLVNRLKSPYQASLSNTLNETLHKIGRTLLKQFKIRQEIWKRRPFREGNAKFEYIFLYPLSKLGIYISVFHKLGSSKWWATL